MLAFVLRRVVQAVLVMLTVAFIAFMLFQYVGDPVTNILGQDATPEQRRQLRSDLGLDSPFPVQFARFVGEAVKINVNLPLEGRRRFHGTITGIEGDRITIEQDGEAVTIVHANVAKARLAPDYAALGLAAAQREYEEGRTKKRGRKK